jgi:hypothetical protein
MPILKIFLMKALYIYCREFAYNPTIKTLEGVSDDVTSARFENVRVAFLQAEHEDVERERRLRRS